MRPRDEASPTIARLRGPAPRTALAALAVASGLVLLAPPVRAWPPGPQPPVELLLDTNPGGSGSLALEKGRMRHAVGRDNGTLRVSGVLDARDLAATFESRVLADASSMQVRDGGAFSAVLSFVGCTTLRRSMRCKSADRGVQVAFRATDQANVYKVTVTAKKLSSAVTGVPQPRGPITALFSDGGGNERPGTLSDCQKSGRHALRCKH